MEDYYSTVGDYHQIFIKTEVEDAGETCDPDTKPVFPEILESIMREETENNLINIKLESEIIKHEDTNEDLVFANKCKLEMKVETYDEFCNTDTGSIYLEENRTEAEGTSGSTTQQQIYTDIRPFKCDKCSFATKTEPGLRKHQKVHQEIKLYNCDKCSYQTQREDYFKTHQLVHTSTSLLSSESLSPAATRCIRKARPSVKQESSEVKPYKCDQCPFSAKRQSNLRCHQLVHKAIKEVPSYSCPTCDYVTKYKSDLVRHKLIHLDPNEVVTFKCNSCDFIAKHQSNLKKHQLVHKSTSEVKIFNCPKCNFVTRHYSSLYKHQLTHLAPILQCDQCDYKAVRWANFRQHQLIHKDFSEVETFKCNYCDFITKRKMCLKSHIAKNCKKAPRLDAKCVEMKRQK